MQTSTPFPGFDPGELVNFREAEAITGVSEYTLRSSWEEMGAPFELIGGRRLAKRDALLAWKDERAKKELDTIGEVRAEAMWRVMQERRAAEGRS